MKAIELEKAKAADSIEITQVQTRAFNREADLAGIVKDRGPSGYDNEERTNQLIDAGRMFKATIDGRTMGGAVVTLKNDGTGRINRIFVDPDWQRHGIGQGIIRSVIGSHPTVKRWGLDTPEWSRRNQIFYQKLGFHEVRRYLEPESGFKLIEYVLEVE